MTERSPTDMDRKIAALRASLTPEEQQTFAAFFAAALDAMLADAHMAAQDTPELAADPDVVEAELVTMLLQRSNGISADGTPDLCFVPLQAGRLYRFSRSTPATAPSPADGGAAPPLPSRSRVRWAIALVMVSSVVLVGLAWHARTIASAEFTAVAAAVAATDVPPSATSTPPATPSALIDVRNRDADTDDPTTLEIGEDDQLVLRVVPTRSELGGVWAPPLQEGTAAWLAGSVVNPIFCVPSQYADQLADLARGAPILVRRASGTLDRYDVFQVLQLGRQQTEILSQRDAKLTLIACDAPGNTRRVVTALFRPAVDGLLPPPDVRRAVIPAWVAVEHVATALTEEGDAMGVAIEMRLTNESEQPLPLTDLIDQLLVQGEAVPAELHPRMEPLDPHEQRIITFSYRVPRSAARTQAIWQVIAPDGQRADVLVSLVSP